MTNRRRDGLLLLASLAAMAMPAPARSQSPDGRLTGTAELGWRGFIDRPSALQRAKFEEYRDLTPGPFLQALRIELRVVETGEWEKVILSP